MMQQKPISFSPAYIVLLVVLMVPFVYAAFFTFPGGDDYARSVLAAHLFDLYGGAKEMLRAWMKWSGRYTHHFLVVFFGDTALSRLGYAAACLANMLLHYLALAGICRELSAPAPRRTAATLALFLLFSLAATHGSINSSWYLLTDILCLGVGVGLSLTYIWSLCLMWNVPNPARKHRVFCIASCIAAAGCYEYTTAMCVIISVTAYLLARAHNHPHLRFFRTMFVISFVCLLASFLCRGNFRRRTKRDVDSAVMMAQLAGVWAEWCRHVAPKLVTPLYLSLVAWAAWITPRSKNDATTKIPALFIVLYCGMVATGFLVLMALVHASSDVTVGETGKIAAHMSIFCAMIFGFCLMACRNAFHLPLLRKIPICLLFLACLAPLVTSYNLRTILWNEATGALEQYAGAREIRKAYLRARASSDLTVAPLDILPFPVGNDPVKANPKAWPTKYVSKAYGLDKVHAEPRSAAAAYAAFGAPSEERWRAGDSQLNGISSLMFAQTVSSAPNPTFDSDWLFLSVSPEFLATDPAMRVTVTTPTTLASLSGSVFQELVMKRPCWLRQNGTGRVFHLADPAYIVRADEKTAILGLPVNASGIPATGVYMSLDGKTYFPLKATK